jgi:hypothetical protein
VSRATATQGSKLAAALLALWATDAALPPRDDDLSTRRIAPLVRHAVCGCADSLAGYIDKCADVPRSVARFPFR